MRIVFYLLVLICGIFMFIGKREYKLGFLVLPYFLFTPVTLPFVPHLISHACHFVLFCFIISELFSIKPYFRTFKDSGIWLAIGVILIYSLISIYTSKNITTENLHVYVFNELLFSFFVIIYGFIGLKNFKSLKFLTIVIFISLIFLTVVSIDNYVSKVAGILDAIRSEEDNVMLSNKFQFAKRFRVNSLFINPADYGYICVISCIWFIYAYAKKLVNNKIIFLSIIMSLWGMFACGFRSVPLAFVISFVFYLCMAYDIGRFSKYIFFSLISFLFLYIQIPFFQELVNHILTVFDPTNTEGSSLEMREMQLAAVLSHIQGHEYFGCGYHYFIIDLGYIGEGRSLDVDLLGLEGVYLEKILENGYVGYFLYLLFMFIILWCILKKRYFDKKTSGIAIMLMVAYICFSNLTGELESRAPTLLFMGVFIKILQIKKYNTLFENNRIHNKKIEY